MTPEAIIEDRRFQETLDKIRKEEGYDFAAIAFYESNKPSSPIKWHYVSGNKNNRFKLIILRKGRGLAGTVMKTGKRMVIANVGLALGPEEKIDYPILLSESLTAVLAVPLGIRIKCMAYYYLVKEMVVLYQKYLIMMIFNVSLVFSMMINNEMN